MPTRRPAVRREWHLSTITDGRPGVIITGLTQHRIAKLTGQSQSEVSEIPRRAAEDAAARPGQGLGHSCGARPQNGGGLRPGRLDTAESFVVASVRRWEGISALHGAHSATVLATIHVRAGEPNALQLAHSAITAVTRLSSASARQRLEPLASALEARPGSDARDLVRTARKVATTRA